MESRRGEKVGWIGGWLGGFVWVVILSVVFLIQSKLTQGGVGLLLAGFAVLTIFASAPWRHANTVYWKLMLPVYVLFVVSVAWGIWSAGGLKPLGLNPWNGFLILPVLIPFWTTGRRRWTDGDSRGRGAGDGRDR
jgi:uncharacterized membrane protein YfcA